MTVPPTSESLQLRTRQAPQPNTHAETVLIDLVQELVQRMPGRAGLTVTAVHRLDRNTSGLMLFALSATAREKLIDMFHRHEIHRQYLAIALGLIAEPTTIRSHLIRDRGDGLRGSTLAQHEDAKLAITHIEPIQPIAGRYTLLRCTLQTGRTHQIRIHLSEFGHMLCGERRYIRPTPDASPAADDSGAPRHALHSTFLSFTHPMTGKPMKFSSPLPRDLRRWLDSLQKK